MWYEESDKGALTMNEILQEGDGSVTGLPQGGAVVRMDQFMATKNCVPRANWNLQICEESFAQVSIYI